MSWSALLQAMRPHQWVKNLLLFAPLLFAHDLSDPDLPWKLSDPEALWQATRAFICFCLLSSSIYLLNDVRDIEADRLHPRKRLRPIAAGKLSPKVATLASLVCMTISFAIAISLGGEPLPFVVLPAAYLILNTAYSLHLKRIAIVDALCIAMGFQIRVHAGSVAIDVQSSKWLLLCTFFFATFLAFCKRREEVATIEDAHEGATRASLKAYSVHFIDQLLAPMAALSILTYALYTLDAETVAKHGPNLMVTVPIVVFGVFRYLWLVHERGEGGEPSRLLFRDRQLQIAGVLWLVLVLAVLWFEPDIRIG